MFLLKEGILISRLTPQAVLAALIAAPIFEQYGVDTVITSGEDGQHSAISLHYEGQALDFRTRDLPDRATAEKVADRLRKNLGENFDVVVESDHIHVEYDPI